LNEGISNNFVPGRSLLVGRLTGEAGNYEPLVREALPPTLEQNLPRAYDLVPIPGRPQAAFTPYSWRLLDGWIGKTHDS
jgi:hypothetical protein